MVDKASQKWRRSWQYSGVVLVSCTTQPDILHCSARRPAPLRKVSCSTQPGILHRSAMYSAPLSQVSCRTHSVAWRCPADPAADSAAPGPAGHQLRLHQQLTGGSSPPWQKKAALITVVTTAITIHSARCTADLYSDARKSLHLLQ